MPVADPQPTRTAGKLFTRPVLSWALYDLGNTVFSMNIVSYFLSIWVVNEMGGTDTMWARATSISMFMMLMTAPFLGAISDQAGRRLPFLLASTTLCIALTAFLGVPGLMGTLVLFVFANYFFQAGLIFYDATLPLVSTPATRGRIGGLGIGLGYIGSFIGLGVGFALQSTMGYEWVFRATALLFALFAIPIFLFVKEPRRVGAGLRAGSIGRAAGQVVGTIREVRRYRGLPRFLIGRAFYTDAANTLILFLGIYVTNEVGLSTDQSNVLLMTSVAAAVVGGFAWGNVVDRLGPKRTLNLVLGCWAVTLGMAAVIPVAGLPPSLFFGVAALAGISLGGTWAADRPYMLLLSPPAKVGEFYGLYSMIGRFSAVVGPLVWAYVAEGLGLGRPASVSVLLLMVVIAWWILRGVDDRPRDWTPAEMGTAGSDLAGSDLKGVEG